MQARVELCFRNDFGELYCVESLGVVDGASLQEIIDRSIDATDGRYHGFHVCSSCSRDLRNGMTLLSEGVRTIGVEYDAEEITTSFLRLRVFPDESLAENPDLLAEECPIRGERANESVVAPCAR